MAEFDEIMKQAQIMQEKLKVAQEDISSLEVIGQSGTGLVKVVMNGRHELRRVMIDPTLFYFKNINQDTSDTDGGEDDAGSQGLRPKNADEARNMVQELVAAAVNDAVRKIEDQSREKMASLAEGMQLPEGFKLPAI